LGKAFVNIYLINNCPEIIDIWQELPAFLAIQDPNLVQIKQIPVEIKTDS